MPEGSSNEHVDSSPDHTSPIEYDIPAEEIYFPDQGNDDGYYCVCFVDMVNSTQIIAQIANSNRIKRYYAIFLNAIATVAKNFGAIVIKNVGDALVFYFPNTLSSDDRAAFREVLECCTAIVAARDFINAKLRLEGLPDVSYRISADYGKVEVGKAVKSGAEDLFGPTVSICSKINSKAEPNGIVIGGDLYQIIKRFSFDEYTFKGIKDWPIGIKYPYPVYSVVRKDKVPFQNSRRLSSLFKKSTTTATKPRSGTVIGISGSSSSSSFPNSQRQKQDSYAVMLVDDEPDVLAIFKSFLIEEGYEVEAFSDSYKALMTFARSQPGHFDLVILDIRMPTMNGLQLYQRLKAIDPHIKVIFLSALDATEELVSILEGIESVDVIRKPIDRKHFIQKVKATLEDEEATT